MYALARNSWKYENRDAKLYSHQIFEYDYLAPDTVEELFDGIDLLEKWAGGVAGGGNGDAQTRGRKLLTGGSVPKEMQVDPIGIEASRRGVVVRRISEGYRVFREMIHYYGVKVLLEHIHRTRIGSLDELRRTLSGSMRTSWINLGGQLVTTEAYAGLIEGVTQGVYETWDKLHEEYGRIAAEYPEAKARHAFASLLSLHGIEESRLDSEVWRGWLDDAAEIQKLILARTRESREKDYQSVFKKMMYDSDDEMNEVLGPFDQNSFIRKLEKDTVAFLDGLNSIRF
jgi:hypothetical protein